jgi:hypothetical protein
MRRSRDRDNIILEDADGKPYGIYLAADYTSAHEEGIERIERMFGIDRSIPGIPGRAISRSIPHVAFREKSIRVETAESKKGRRRYEEHTIQFLIVDSYFNDETSYHYNMLIDREFQAGEIEILGAFSKEAFALAAYSDRAKAAIDEIKFGLDNNDLAIMMGGGSKNPFDRGGLVVARASKIPAEQAQVTLEADLAAKRLDDAAEATGIKAKIDAMPINRGPLSMKRYFALHPSWAKSGLTEGRSTAHPVIFFLNPAQQDKNNHGWFTVEELEQWLDGKGPIPKVPTQAAA